MRALAAPRGDRGSPVDRPGIKRGPRPGPGSPYCIARRRELDPFARTYTYEISHQMDARRLLLVFGLLAAAAPLASAGDLSLDFYKSSCPDAEKIVTATIEQKIKEEPGTAAGLLRLLFHDCFANVRTSHMCIVYIILDLINPSIHGHFALEQCACRAVTRPS